MHARTACTMLLVKIIQSIGYSHLKFGQYISQTLTMPLAEQRNTLNNPIVNDSVETDRFTEPNERPMLHCSDCPSYSI